MKSVKHLIDDLVYDLSSCSGWASVSHSDWNLVASSIYTSVRDSAQGLMHSPVNSIDELVDEASLKEDIEDAEYY